MLQFTPLPVRPNTQIRSSCSGNTAPRSMATWERSEAKSSRLMFSVPMRGVSRRGTRHAGACIRCRQRAPKPDSRDSLQSLWAGILIFRLTAQPVKMRDHLFDVKTLQALRVRFREFLRCAAIRCASARCAARSNQPACPLRTASRCRNLSCVFDATQVAALSSESERCYGMLGLSLPRS